MAILLPPPITCQVPPMPTGRCYQPVALLSHYNGHWTANATASYCRDIDNKHLLGRSDYFIFLVDTSTFSISMDGILTLVVRSQWRSNETKCSHLKSVQVILPVLAGWVSGCYFIALGRMRISNFNVQSDLKLYRSYFCWVIRSLFPKFSNAFFTE